MLGLLSTLSRRERMQASSLLDSKLVSELQEFSSGYQQQQAFQAIQDQASALPAVANQLGELATSLASMGADLNQGISEHQDKFQGAMVQNYNELNSTINQNLSTGLQESSQMLGDTIQPLVETAMTALSSMAEETNERLLNLSERQFAQLSDATKANSELVQQSVEACLQQQRKSSEDLLKVVNQSTEKSATDLKSITQQLLDESASNNERWIDQQQAQVKLFSDVIRDELASLRNEEQGRGDAAVARLDDLNRAVAGHLATLGSSLEEPMTRLIETASETPKAAAEVIEKLRGEMTKNVERDNELLVERKALMQQIDELSINLSGASNAQGQAIDSLIEQSSKKLEQVSNQFGEKLEGESARLAQVVEHFASSSVEMASLADAFNAAVSLFSDSNNKLMENLASIESSLEQSNSRSDEQLAYYVAQAREIIDHNLLSHQQIIAALHAQKPTQLAVTEASS